MVAQVAFAKAPAACALSLYVAWLLVGSTGLSAQAPPDPHTAQPERPTVATHAGTVAPGWVEIEAGAEFDRYDDRTRGGAMPVVAKIGVAPSAQLSIFGAAVQSVGAGTGIGDLGVSIKWRLADAPVLGRFAVFPSLKIPTGSAATGTGTDTTDVGLLLISSHALGPVALDLNIGYTRRSGTGLTAPRDATVWTVSFGGPAAGRLGWVAELYGYPKTSGPTGADSTVALLAGPTVQVRPWLVFDTGMIVPVTGPQPHALYAGTVYNIGRVWRR